MKQEKYIDSIKMSNEAIRIDKNHWKSIFRRGKCYLNIGDEEKALEDFVKANQINSENKEIQRELGKLKEKIKVMEQKQMNAYSKMFNNEKDSSSSSTSNSNSNGNNNNNPIDISINGHSEELFAKLPKAE